MQTEENKSDENRIRERIKKSSMAAEDTFDYLKLTADAEGLIPCTFEETPEEVVFEYDVTGLKALENMEREPEENRLRFLINFVRLYDVFLQYRFDVDEKNIFYDENMLPCVKTRDLYERD